jgi:Cu/Ag efflux pump CusA
MRRIAAPMVGGVVSVSLVILLVLPVLYVAVHGRGLPAEHDGNPEPAADV